jgi:hypothetical protein
MLSGPVAPNTLGSPRLRLRIVRAGPLRRQRLVPEQLVERAVADEAQDLLDLTAGLALAAEPDSLLSEGGKLLGTAHLRTLVRTTDILAALPSTRAAL